MNREVAEALRPRLFLTLRHVNPASVAFIDYANSVVGYDEREALRFQVCETPKDIQRELGSGGDDDPHTPAVVVFDNQNFSRQFRPLPGSLTDKTPIVSWAPYAHWAVMLGPKSVPQLCLEQSVTMFVKNFVARRTKGLYPWQQCKPRPPVGLPSLRTSTMGIYL
ncbi:MAG: hypothetical protein AAB452_01200 [Patescibacteria group bacterium]